MPQFTVYDSTGLILSSGYVAGAAADAQKQAGAGEFVLVDAKGQPGIHQVNLSNPAAPVLQLIPIAALTLADLKSAAKATVADRRWVVETGGIAFGSGTLATDDRSKILLLSAVQRARLNPAFTVNWKTGDGTWTTLNAATLIAAGDAVLAWVDHCFAREQALGALVDAASDADAVAALTPTLQAFW